MERATLFGMLHSMLSPIVAVFALVGQASAETSTETFVTLARDFVQSLETRPPVIPQSYLHEFDAPRRTTIDYLPLVARADQHGVRIGLLSLPQRRSGHGMLRSLLSSEGYLRVQAIRSLEVTLAATDVIAGFARDADAYTFQFFGDPNRDEPWAMKFEGHHLSLNATVVDGVMRGTPLFLGASPAEVRTGPDAGLRVMAPQRDLARALVASFTPDQRISAVKPEFVPGDTIPVGVPVELGRPAGLPAREMTPGQQQLLVRVVVSFARNLNTELADEALRRLDANGVDALHFLWRGGLDVGDTFSYWIQGPTVAIQFDMIEDGPGVEANHIHALWRDPSQDFGEDLLRAHYEQHHESHLE